MAYGFNMYTVEKAIAIVEHLNLQRKYRAYHKGRKVFVEGVSVAEAWVIIGAVMPLYHDNGERVIFPNELKKISRGVIQ